MKKTNRIISILLATMMVVCMLPMSVFAIGMHTDSNGIVYELYDDMTAELSDATSLDANDVVIPDTVTKDENTYTVTTIKNDAFNHCASLVSITLPNSLNAIGTFAFNHCISLKEVTIPNSVKTIENNAFNHCTSLESITLPNNLSNISNSAFANCTSLESITIQNSVKTIENNAFDHCTSLKGVTIPNSVTTIGNNAFDHCTSLKSLTLPNSLNTIGNSVFAHCISLKEVTIPNSVTAIGIYAFDHCTSLASITLPNTLNTISNSAFAQCTSLASITLPNSVKTIGNNAFDNCTALKSITLPSGISTIDNVAFWMCSNLTTLVIPDGLPNLTDVGNSAFYNVNLTDVFIKEAIEFSGDAYEKLKTEAFSDSIRIWNYRENGRLPDGKTEIEITSAKDKDGNVWSSYDGAVIRSNHIDGYKINSFDSQICVAENLEGGQSKNPKEWTAYGEHFYDNGYEVNSDGTHSPKCRCDAVSDITDEHTMAAESDYYHKCADCGLLEDHKWKLQVTKEVTDAVDGEIKYECNDCGHVIKEVITALENNEDFLSLNGSVTQGSEQVECIIQDPYGTLPGDTQLNVTPVTDGTRFDELNEMLDDKYDIEHALFYDITLINGSTGEELHQLEVPVRVLLQVPQNWDKSEIESVLVKSSDDVEFEETTFNIGGIEYTTFWTDHFSPYATIDKMVLSKVENVSDISKTYDGALVAEPTYAYDGDGQVMIKWFADLGGSKGEEIDRPTNVGTYWVGISVSVDGTYNANYEVIKQFTISKATPTVEPKPTASRVIIGGKLSDSTLTGGVVSTAGTFAWKYGAEVLGSKGTAGKTVVFTPNDAENYNTAQFDVDVTVVLCNTKNGEHKYTSLKHDDKDHWYECAKCGDIKADSKSTHTFEWKVDKEPTATEEGSKHEECTVCKAKQNENTAIPKNETNSPQTGDNSNIALWVALLFVSGMGLLTTTVFDRKKKQTKQP